MFFPPPSETGEAVPPVEREGAGGRVLVFVKDGTLEILKGTPQILFERVPRALAASLGLAPWSKARER
jgi:hypothetical protein